MIKTVIGIPTYNGSNRLDNLLYSIWLRTTNCPPIVVVDDGSPTVALTTAVYQKWATKLNITYIVHEQNRGISAGWNTCSRTINAENVVLINDDVIISDGWLDALLHPLDHSPQVGVVGQSWHAFTLDDVPELLRTIDSDKNVIPRDPVTKAQVPERRATYEDTNPGRVMCPTGQLFAFRRKDFDEIGGFCEEMRSFYEESLFGSQMAMRGKIGVQLNWPFNWHMWSATFGNNPELNASERLRHSHNVYCRIMNVPDEWNKDPFGYINPKYLGAIGDVPVEFLRKEGKIARGILRQDGAFVEST